MTKTIHDDDLKKWLDDCIAHATIQVHMEAAYLEASKELLKKLENLDNIKNLTTLEKLEAHGVLDSQKRFERSERDVKMLTHIRSFLL